MVFQLKTATIMSERMRISVITVVKNAAHCLEDTIMNVIETKTAAQIDYIIIDGGSTDGTTDIIRKFADHISYWVSETDNGIYDAMNKGWAAAAADSFILFIGAGDRIISLPEDMNGYCKDDVIYGSVLMDKKWVFKSKANIHLRIYNTLHHQALLVPKSLHLEPPFNPAYSRYADFDFNQRLFKMGAHFCIAPEFQAEARAGGISDSPDFRESLEVIYKNYGSFWCLVSMFCHALVGIMPSLRRLTPCDRAPCGLE